MAAANPSQLLLLSDHIKLSLLERQRAITLNLGPSVTQDAQIARNLNQLEAGISTLERQSRDWNDPHNPVEEQQQTLLEEIDRLRSEYKDLESQFRGLQPAHPTTLTIANDLSLATDFTSAQNRKASKSVRFSDSPEAEATAHVNGGIAQPNSRYAPYRDEPEDDGEAGRPDHTILSNQQIHEYHQGILREQDEQLDRLGLSIGRQRDLSIQIGDELDDHVMLLDEVDERVDRHQGQLNRAGRRLTTFARKARDNWTLTTIVVLIIILLLLIIITK